MRENFKGSYFGESMPKFEDKPMTNKPCQPAIENLTNEQVQADEDGVFVTVSRQALDEVLEYLAAAPERPEQGELERLRSLYHELLYQVSIVHPNETRHETALRYIRQAEHRSNDQCQASKEDGE